jgi:hypothetical protein
MKKLMFVLLLLGSMSALAVDSTLNCSLAKNIDMGYTSQLQEIAGSKVMTEQGQNNGRYMDFFVTHEVDDFTYNTQVLKGSNVIQMAIMETETGITATVKIQRNQKDSYKVILNNGQEEVHLNCNIIKEGKK